MAEEGAAMADPATILAVEDDEEVRALIREVLAREGFRVLEAASGEAALAVLEAEPVDLLFTDIVMPGLNGLDLGRLARRLRPGVRILYASAFGPHLVAQPEAKDFVRKPYRPRQLVARIKRSLLMEASAQAPS
ncbi:MAG TPA: response regulator [Stellaceae bacterium]|nr:response regulator [Stellaceae bacterium]